MCGDRAYNRVRVSSPCSSSEWDRGHCAWHLSLTAARTRSAHCLGRGRGEKRRGSIAKLTPCHPGLSRLDCLLASRITCEWGRECDRSHRSVHAVFLVLPIPALALFVIVQMADAILADTIPPEEVMMSCLMSTTLTRVIERSAGLQRAPADAPLSIVPARHGDARTLAFVTALCR